VPRSRIEPHDVPISPSYGALKAATINYMAQLAQRWTAGHPRQHRVARPDPGRGTQVGQSARATASDIRA